MQTVFKTRALRRRVVVFLRLDPLAWKYSLLWAVLRRKNDTQSFLACLPVMTASWFIGEADITLCVDYFIVFFLAFRILDRDHFGRVFCRPQNGVF